MDPRRERGRAATWAGRLALIAVVGALAVAVERVLPENVLYAQAAHVTAIVTYPMLLVAAVLIYVHFRLDTEGGTAWLAAAAVFGAGQGVGFAGLRMVMASEVRPRAVWLVLVEVAVAAVVVLLVAASGRVRVRVDPLLLGLGLALVVTAARVWVVSEAAVSSASVDLRPLLVGVVLGLYVVTAVLVAGSPFLPGWAGQRFAVVVVLMAASNVLTFPLPADDWHSLLAVAANLAGTVLLGATSLQLVRRAIRRQEESRSELRELHEQLLYAEANVRDDRTLLHEIASTVAAVTSASRVLASASQMTPHERDQFEELLASETARLERMMGTRDDVSVAELDLDATIAPVLLAHRIRGRAIDWTPSGQQVVGRADDVVEVLDILLENSAQHSGSPSVQVSACRREDEVDITVADHGRGIPRELADSVFDWGTRGRESRGQGIGLNVAHRLVTDQGGRLTLISDERSGTRCTVTVPAAGPRQRSEEVHSLALSTSRAAARVLFVEDGPHVTESVALRESQSGWISGVIS
jgi:signal transduction histidine kinase